MQINFKLGADHADGVVDTCLIVQDEFLGQQVQNLAVWRKSHRAGTIDGGADGSTPALTGYGDAEIDLYGGYTHTFHGVGVDVGLLYYFYGINRPGSHPNTDFFEP